MENTIILIIIFIILSVVLLINFNVSSSQITCANGKLYSMQGIVSTDRVLENGRRYTINWYTLFGKVVKQTIE